MAKALTSKQLAFACAFIETGNATEAYRRAYDASKMSKGAIEVEACRLLARPNVAAKVEELRGKAADVASILVSLATPPVEEPDTADASSDEPTDAALDDPKPPDPKDPKPLPTLSPEVTLSAEAQAVISRAWVLSKLAKNARIALGEETVRIKVKVKVKGKDDDEVTEMEVTQRNGAVANKALELLGRVPEVALFTDQPSAPDQVSAERIQMDAWFARVKAEAVTLRPVRVAPPVIDLQPAPVDTEPKAYDWLPNHTTKEE